MSDAPTDFAFTSHLDSVPEAVGGDCPDCSGTGFTVQGWTDKNGYSEDQYGPCARCLRRVRAEAATTGQVAHQTACKPGGACAWDCERPLDPAQAGA